MDKVLKVLTACLAATAALSGCSGSDEPPPTQEGERPVIGAGKGAIAGLVIDDVFRPVPGALVLVQTYGLTATTDADGEFRFLDLEPGSYVLVVSEARHEASPRPVDVEAGKYNEVEIMARRIFDEGGYTVTTAYSVFIPCAVDVIATGFVEDCTADQSGDSFRAFFLSDYRDYGANVTYLVTEMLANKEGRYEIQIRCDDNIDRRFAVSQFNGIYTRLVMPFQNVSEQSAEASYGPNVAWENDCKLQTIMFADSQGREELQGAGAPVCCGAGVHFGIKGKFLATLFLGEPDTDIATYCILAPGGTCGP
jgi:hypothetical protein